MLLLNTIAMVVGYTVIGATVLVIIGGIVAFFLLGMNKSTG